MVVIKDKILLTYLILVEIVAVVIFLNGYFPFKPSSGKVASFNDLPSNIYSHSLNISKLYKPYANKLVFMVIDALRYDFVDSYKSLQNMPFVHSEVSNKMGCIWKSRVAPPTVTMPRLKALMTGNVPGFVDVVMNFGSNELKEDNFIHQAVQSGLRVIFYGDDTWLKLFPNKFLRSEGTTSFYVSDFIEVDLNVTRNVLKELLADDWDVMILHYLGLDHIGHLQGPGSVLVKPKLLEMDHVIKLLSQKFRDMENKGLGTGRIVICGDHGMKDSGGHGGTSDPEIYIPVVILGETCDGNVRDLDQIDMTPFLSVVMGLPIPADSFGKLNYRMIKNWDPLLALYAIYYNTQRITTLYAEFYGSQASENDELATYLNANKLFKRWIESNFTNSEYHSALEMYLQCQKTMSSKLIQNSVLFDHYAMVLAMLMFVQVIVLILTKKDFLISGNKFKSSFICGFFAFLSLNYVICSFWGLSSKCCSFKSNQIFILCLAAIFTLNTIFIVDTKLRLKVSLEINLILCSGYFLHLISLFSSSLIEEEHQCWYFFCVTLCVYCLPRNVYPWVFILLMHGKFRKLNHAGDKWASLPVISDWLNLQENKNLLSVIHLAGLAGVFCCCVVIYDFQGLKKGLKYFNNLLVFGMLVSVYTYRVATGICEIPFYKYPLSSGYLEAKTFWILEALMLFAHFYTVLKSPQTMNIKHIHGILYEVAVLTVCLLYRPHNVILLPGLFYFSSKVYEAMKTNINNVALTHYFLGMIFFFYQGNSNSLANIDIAAGYVGLQDFNSFIIGFFLVLNTYSGPILSYLLMFCHLTTESFATKKRDQVCYAISLFLSVQLLIFLLVAVLQRNHLFVWSVFSPKLLYVALHFVVNSFVLIMSYIPY